MKAVLLRIYQLLDDHYGSLHWWPADTKDEVAIGAILVQNVAWSNTIKAIDRLRNENLLTLASLVDAPLTQIEACVVSTRFYKMKAKKLQAFAVHFSTKWNGDWRHVHEAGLTVARPDLLSVWGIGPETADDILLYAAALPTFVVDAYTTRIFTRLGIVSEGIRYEPLRALFMDYLEPDTALYNQYHALIDALGHRVCLNKQPRCPACPLLALCAWGASR